MPIIMIENMSFKNYAKGFENGNWLCRDEEVWKKYNEDKYCGTPFPVSFYRSLFKNMGRLNRGIKDIDKDTKIMLIYGDQDPVGSKGKQIQKLYKLYLKNSLNCIIKGYAGGRHEILNETNKDEVLSDIIDFLSK